MPAAHEAAIREIVNRRIREGDPYMSIVMETMGRMNDGFYPEWILNSVAQKYRARNYDLQDAFCFLQVLTHLYQGDLLTARVEVGETPTADKLVERNNAMLADLQDPFYASFTGGLSDDDGKFGWSLPIALCRHDLNLETDIEHHSLVTVEPTEIHLEVGSTQASRSLLHIRHSGGLARWPYGSTQIYVFLYPDYLHHRTLDGMDREGLSR